MKKANLISQSVKTEACGIHKLSVNRFIVMQRNLVPGKIQFLYHPEKSENLSFNKDIIDLFWSSVTEPLV